MVAGTGEAPSGIVAYESDGLPAEYLGNLLVTSWGDHRIDRFRLNEQKASTITSVLQPMITGGENFRPVGIALAPDGSLYCTDWVLKDYKLHGKGKVWRISSSAKPISKADSKKLTSTDVSIQEYLSQIESFNLHTRKYAAYRLAETADGRQRLLTVVADNQSRGVRPRIDALCALVQVPLEVENLDFWGKRLDLSRKIFDSWIEGRVFVEAFGSAQLPWDQRSNLRTLLSPNETRGWAIFSGGVVTLLKLQNLDERLWRQLLEEGVIYKNHFYAGALISHSRINTRGPTTPQEMTAFKIAGTQFDFEPGLREWREAIGLAAARASNPKNKEMAIWGLSCKNSLPKRVAVQWIAEEGLKDLRPQVEAILNDPNISADLFLATLAALEMLDGVPPAEFDKSPPGKYVLPLVKNEQSSPAVRARALALVDPNDPALTDELMIQLLGSQDAGLKLEAIRTMQGVAKRGVSDSLREIAKDETADVNLRAEAIVALATTVHGRVPDDKSLTDLRQGISALRDYPMLQIEKIRALRGHSANRMVERSLRPTASGVKRKVGDAEPTAADREWADQLALALTGRKFYPDFDPPIASAGLQSKRPANRDEWNATLKEPGDAAAGRRTFFHVNSAGCYKCHTVNGRGGRIGPDLSTVGRALSRERLIDSILEPSKEIAPQFVSWSIETSEGKVHTGMIVHENEGKTILGNAEGQLVELKTLDIAERAPQTTSVMPDKLADRLTPQEFRDLLAFLESLR